MRRAIQYLILVLILLFLTGPFLWLLLTSLKGADLFKLTRFWDVFPHPATTEAYRKVLTDNAASLPRMFYNTVIICVIGVTLELVIASLAAYPLARMEFRGKTAIFAIMLASMMLPAQANMIVNFNTIRFFGLYDTLTAVWLPGLVSVFGIFLMRQAYLVIPVELDDAARIDGANAIHVWWNVLLPLSRPALATLAIFGFVGHWNNLLWPLIILKSESNYPVAVGLTWLSGVFASQFSLVAAGCVLATIPVVGLFLAMQRQFIAGITSGAVK